MISELIFADFSGIVFKLYGENLCFVGTIQCRFIIEAVCLNLYKFGCYLMQGGTLSEVCILGSFAYIL